MPSGSNGYIRYTSFHDTISLYRTDPSPHTEYTECSQQPCPARRPSHPHLAVDAVSCPSLAFGLRTVKRNPALLLLRPLCLYLSFLFLFLSLSLSPHAPSTHHAHTYTHIHPHPRLRPHPSPKPTITLRDLSTPARSSLPTPTCSLLDQRLRRMPLPTTLARPTVLCPPSPAKHS